MDAQAASPHQDVFLAGGATVKGDDVQVGDVVNMDWAPSPREAGARRKQSW